MTVYVYRDGQLVEKHQTVRPDAGPYISRFEAYESPVTGKTISSDRQREVDLFKSSAYDVRDVGPNHAISRAKEARKAENARQRPTQLDFWRDRN
jgi:hypothetical protein